MPIRKHNLARRPIFQPLVSVAVFAVPAVLGGCLTTGVRSTGVKLPLASEQIVAEAVVVEVEHNCSDGRCTGFDATFENRLEEELEIQIAGARLSRAGESLALAHDDKLPQKNLVVPAKKKISASFLTVHASKKNPMTYVRPTSVWCSLKVDSACADASQGEAECAAAARAYYQQYVDLKGWIETSFAVKGKSWKKAELVTSAAPQFFGNKPSVTLGTEGDSPFWYGMNSQHTVFFRYACDDKCACAPLEKPREFVSDDAFLPVPPK